jgi:NAD(P)H-dependent FMN reductase
MLKLNVVIASTRPGRAGLPIGNWFVERANYDGRFEVVVADLKEWNLPMLDEPKHPRFEQYEHAHTKAWSANVRAADAFVFVTPEYNYGLPPALVNAFDYVYNEWNYKAAGFVSYGGISGGMRSVQMSKMILTALKMMPIPESVAIPFFSSHLKEGQFQGTDVMNKSVTTMLDELHRWADALKPMRA